MSPTRTRALAAAVELLGTEGLRALTHGKVDDRAGLPRGSTSNFFRTRAALLLGVTHWVAEQDLQMVRPVFTPATPEDFLDILCGLVDFASGPNRTLTTARLILFLEAGHHPELRGPLTQVQRRMAAAIEGALAGLGAPDPTASAAALMACAEGLILHRIARHDAREIRPVLRLAVNAALPGRAAGFPGT